MKTGRHILIFAAIIIFLIGVNYYANRSESVVVPDSQNLRITGPASADTLTAALKTMPPDHDLLMQTKRLEDHIKKNPDDLDHLIMLGNLYFDRGRFDEALGTYQKALTGRPDNDDVRVDYAVCLYNTGKPMRAVEELERVIQNNPRHQTAYYNMGVIFLNMKRDEEARKYLEHVLHINPHTDIAVKAASSLEQIR